MDDEIAVEMAVIDAEQGEEMNVNALIDFAVRLLGAPARAWRDADLNQKQRLQKLFFPRGVRFSTGSQTETGAET